MTKKYARIVVSKEFKKKLKTMSAEADKSMLELSEDLVDLLDLKELEDKRRRKYEFKL